MVQTRKRNLSAGDCSSPHTTDRKSSKVSENVKSKKSSGEAEQNKQRVKNDEGQGMSHGIPVRRSRRLSSIHSAAVPSVSRRNNDCLDVKDGEAALLQTPMVRSLTASSPPGKHPDTMKLSADGHLQATDIKTPKRLSTKRVSVDAEEVDETPAKPSARRISCIVNMDETEQTPTRRSTRRTAGITIANKDYHKPGRQSTKAAAFVDTFDQTPTSSSSRVLVSADIDKVKTTHKKCSVLKRTSVTIDDNKNSDMRSQQSGSEICSKSQALNDATTSGLNLSDNSDVANAVKSKQQLNVISEDNENTKTSACTLAGARSIADIQPSVADIESFREKTELSNISFDDNKSCFPMHIENLEGASKLGENAIACQEEKLQLKLDSSDTDGSENECNVEDINHQEDDINVQGKPNENIKKQGDSKVQSHFECIQVGTEQDATFSKDEDGKNSEIISSSCPNNKENEPVLADQAVSTTDGLYLPYEKPQVDSMSADLNVSPGKISKSTSNTQMVFEDQKDKNHLFTTGLEKTKPEFSSEIVVQKEKMQDLKNVTRGLPESGRWWKKEKKRFRTIFKDATGSKSWAKKMQKKKEREEVLAKSSALEAARQRKRNELKERQKLNKIQREENARKSEIVQVISDTKKLKKMKKRQLRYIESRDTTSTIQQSK